MSLRHIASAVSAVLVAACQGGMPSLPMLPSLSAYRINIQQGNFVTQDMVAKLQPGMTRSQVRFVLGTPLVTDVFHPDRWDYVYRFEKGGKLIEQRRIVAVFNEDKLLRIEGDVVPAKPSAEPVASKPVPAQPAAPATETAVASSPTAKPVETAPPGPSGRP